MKGFYLKKLTSFLLALFLIQITGYTQTYNNDYVDGTVIFQLKTNKKQILSEDRIVDFQNLDLFTKYLENEYNILAVKQLFPGINDEKLIRTYQIEISQFSKVHTLAKKLGEHPDIEYAELKVLPKKSYTPNDTYYGTQYQWGLFKIQAAQAWDLGVGSSNVKVAVTDDAFTINHPDLQGAFLSGWDANNNTANPQPCGYTDGLHGTHVAGTVGCNTDNNTGLASIGFGISIIPVKIANCSDQLVAAYEGVTWAAQNGAHIINMSWGGGGGTYGQNVMNYAENQGCILVAAAGNDNVSYTNGNYPAAYTNVVSVTSTTSTDAKSGFSNYGSWINISAPGSAIYSTGNNNNYVSLQGTSMASPLVAGLLGLMKSYAPNATNAELISCLYSSADPMPNNSYYNNNQMGAGRINAFQALQCLAAYNNDYDLAITDVINPIGNNCSGTITPKVVLKNFGAITITSATITYSWGSTSNTYNWTGNLSSGSEIEVVLPAITATTGSHTFTATVTSPNGQTDENPANNSSSSNFEVIQNGQTVTLTLNTDCWGSETTWRIRDANFVTVATGGPYTDVAGGTQNIYEICLEPGCYTFTIFDSYGDGMSGAQYQQCSVNGYYKLEDEQNNMLFEMTHANGNFGSSTSHPFCVTNDEPEANFTANNTSACKGSTIQFTDQSTNNPSTWNWTFPGGTPSSSTLKNPSVTYSTAGNYTVSLTVSNANGSDTKTINDYITITNSIDVSLTANTDTICEGESVNIVANGATNYAWDNNLGTGTSKTVSPTQTTSYAVTGTNGSCSGADTVTITVNPAPTTPVVTQNDNVLSVNLPANHTAKWFRDNVQVGTGASYTITESGNYKVEVTNEHGCSTSSEMKFIEAVNIQEYAKNNIQVFPNPTEKFVMIEAENMEQIQVYDIIGRKIYDIDLSTQINNNEYQIDLSTHEAGNYIIKVYTRDGVFTKKVTKY